MATLRSDAEVRQDVIEALTCDVRIDASRVSVDVVDHVVILRGVVSSYFEKRTAEDLARRIKGVRDVASELQVVPSQPRPDEEIASEVRQALERDVWVEERTVSVRVENGVVYLSGRADSYTAKSHAEADAWSVAGVTDVVDEIQIAPRISRTDAEIAREVQADLERNLRLDPRQVIVEVREGVVFLRGRVKTLEQKWLAEEIAWWTAGVRDVVSELSVEPPAATAGGAR